MNKTEFHVVAHSLGVSMLEAQRSKKYANKVVWREFFRNHFVAGPGHSDMPTLIELQNRGLMEAQPCNSALYSKGDIAFTVTSKGQSEFVEAFIEQMKGKS